MLRPTSEPPPYLADNHSAKVPAITTAGAGDPEHSS
jgi:hypothetical protein